tara:strand:+ start:395 stop:1153 length:759 start_codon:yes stop_codon:yes gene_type:complete
MKKRLIKGKEHIVYDNLDELRQVMPTQKVYEDWREAPVWSWVLTDDGQVCQILDKGELNKKPYVRTTIGMFHCAPSQKIEGDLRESIYNFSGINSKKIIKNRVNPTKREFLFAKYVAKGDGVLDAFKKAFPDAKSKEYINQQSNLLLKTKRIQKLIDKEIQKLLEKVEISPEYLLIKTKEIIDKEDVRDNDKLNSIKILMELAGMLNKKEKQTESIALFKGFSNEQLKLLEGNNVKKIAEQSHEVHDMQQED